MTERDHKLLDGLLDKNQHLGLTEEEETFECGLRVGFLSAILATQGFADEGLASDCDPIRLMTKQADEYLNDILGCEPMPLSEIFKDVST